MTITQTTRTHLVAIAITAGALMGLSVVAAEAQQVQELFSNMNTGTVQTGAASRASFSLYAPAHVTEGGDRRVSALCFFSFQLSALSFQLSASGFRLPASAARVRSYSHNSGFQGD